MERKPTTVNVSIGKGVINGDLVPERADAFCGDVYRGLYAGKIIGMCLESFGGKLDGNRKKWPTKYIQHLVFLLLL